MPIRRLKRPKSLTEVVLHNIKEAILDGSVKLGEQLSELRLSESLGVSKTPVREALQELRRLGLVRITPKSGTVVFMPDARELSDIFDLRRLLENGAAERLFDRRYAETSADLAAVVRTMEAAIAAQDYRTYRRLDGDFHKVIVAGSGNAMLIATYDTLSLKIDALRNRGLEDLGVVGRSMAFHLRLLDLLQKGDREGFRDGLAQHIANSERDYLNWLDQFTRAEQQRKRAESHGPEDRIAGL